MDCEISRAMSKEIKNARTTITWEQKQRQRTPLRAVRKSQKVISKPVKVFLFTRKDSLMRTREHASECDYSQSRDIG